MGLQKHHHFTDGPVLDPGGANHAELFLGDSLDLGQPIDLLFKDVERLLTKVANDTGCGFGPHPF